FLVSLAVADVLVGAVAIPCAQLADAGLPQGQPTLCLLMLCTLLVFTQASVFGLLAIAVERYISILKPFRYLSLMTPHNALLAILGSWVLATVIGSLAPPGRLATSLFIVLFCFALCWLPLHVINAVRLFCPGCPIPGTLVLAAIVLSHANSAINPVVYVFRMRSFRQAFTAAISCAARPSPASVPGKL
uniref:G-protein coupled receptors family 1 profile domain-containing protein n=1 Tax=Pelodiscus sinensis TaxID=13735 RepID=K7GC66_PELSI